MQKGGWHPQPIHGQSDAVLSEASSQKLVFFASFYRILIKRVSKPSIFLTSQLLIFLTSFLFPGPMQHPQKLLIEVK